MKSQSPFPSMASILAEGRARQARAASCCDGPRNYDVPDAILKQRTLPKLSAPRKGGSPPPVERPRLWEDLARNPRKMGEMRKEGPPPIEPGGDLQSTNSQSCKEGHSRTNRRPGTSAFEYDDRNLTHRSSQPDLSRATLSVDGSWLAAKMALTSESALQIAGKRVMMDGEALGAVLAAANALPAWNAARRRAAKIRREAEAECSTIPTDPTIEPIPAAGGECGCQALETPEVSIKHRSMLNEKTSDSSRNTFNCDSGDVIEVHDGLRFVDPLNGDDRASGKLSYLEFYGVTFAILNPWRSLRAVENWLNSEIYTENGVSLSDSVRFKGVQVYFRAARTWDGTEDGESVDWQSLSSGYGVLEVKNFKAVSTSPLVLSAYSTEDAIVTDESIWTPALSLGEDASGNRPRFDGCQRDAAGAQYGDKRIGVLFLNCCYVMVSNMDIRGFGTGILIRGNSKHHVYQNLYVTDNAQGGISFAVSETDLLNYDDKKGFTEAVKDEIFEIAYDTLAYPEDIVISRCQLSSNGYDTAGADISIGFLSTNCTIESNWMWGDIDGPRGIDGIVANGGSSGHIIDGNYISYHSKWCRESGDAAAVFVQNKGACRSDVDFVLKISCAAIADTYDCEATDYGYRIKTATVSTSDGADAFAEQGIDLKGVRPRTATSGATTIIRNNYIWGHTIFAGIQVDDTSQYIHVYRNRLFQNNHGVVVTNSHSNAWYRAYEDYWDISTEFIYIYRNLVYCNYGTGIKIEGSEAEIEELGGEMSPLRVRRVYVLHNTVAHNLGAGVHVADDTSIGAGPLTAEVTLYNNLFIHNGYSSLGSPIMQVVWDESLSFGSTGSANHSDFNCYLGWDNGTSGGSWSDLELGGSRPVESPVISIGPGASFAATDLEPNSIQVFALLRLSLEDYLDIEMLERGSSGPSGGHIEDSIRTYHWTTVAGLNYDLRPGSPCDDSGKYLPFISDLPDFDERLTLGSKDIGAYNIGGS